MSPEYGYSFTGYDPLLHVRASGREVDISPKAAREVCGAIRGKKLTEARSFLEDVVKMKIPVPYRRYKKKVGHKAPLFKFYAGRYPVKAASRILDVLDNLGANADFRGVERERLMIIHASALRGRKIRAYTPRAHGRSSPSFNTLVHIELVAREV